MGEISEFESEWSSYRTWLFSTYPGLNEKRSRRTSNRVKMLKCKWLHRNRGCRGGTKYEGRQLKVEAGALPDAPCNDSQSWAMTGWKPKQLQNDGDRDRAIGKVTELREVRSSTLRWFSLGITFNTLNLHRGWDEERWQVTESNREQRSTLLVVYDADHLPDNNMRDSLGQY